MILDTVFSFHVLFSFCFFPYFLPPNKIQVLLCYFTLRSAIQTKCDSATVCSKFFELYNDDVAQLKSNPIVLNTIFQVLLLSMTYVPNFMIVACSYHEVWQRAILIYL